MDVFEGIAASFGLFVIAVTLWKLIRHGVARSNGNVETLNSPPGRNNEWRGP